MRRRDFVATVFGAAALGGAWYAGLEAWRARHPHRRPFAGTLSGTDHRSGHRLRDAALGLPSVEPRRVDVVIVGGGPSGLSAAYHLATRGDLDVHLLELEAEAGGTAVASAHGTPWGAHYLPVPVDASLPLSRFLVGRGIATVADDGTTLVPEERFLVRDPDERVFDRGQWDEGLLPRFRMDARSRAAFAAFEAELRALGAPVAGAPSAFALPSRLGAPTLPDGSTREALEAVSAADFLGQRGHTHPLLRWYLEYGTRDDYGTSLAQTSAFALLHYHLSRRTAGPSGTARDGNASPYLTWPEGNAALVRHLREATRERSARVVESPRMLVHGVEERSEGVRVHALDLTREVPVEFDCRACIVATPPFVVPRIHRAPPGEAPPPLDVPTGSWLVANVALSERPRSRGFGLAWENVLFDSPSVGYVSSDHQRGRDHGPTTLTYYLPFVDDDPRRARARLLAGEHAEWAELVVTDLARAHPGLEASVRSVDVHRWGHAMVEPRPGVRQTLARHREARVTRRVRYAHAGWTALPLFEEAFDQGMLAANDVLATLSEPG